MRISESESDDDICAELLIQSESTPMSITSDSGVFSALREIRRSLEKRNLKLYCFASDLRTYPSPMQISMGATTLAYRNTEGKQAMTSDMVDMLDCDDSFEYATVEEQEIFHRKWLNSLK